MPVSQWEIDKHFFIKDSRISTGEFQARTNVVQVISDPGARVSQQLVQEISHYLIIGNNTNETL